MTGATGFVGRSLVLRLLRDRHHVVAWVRDRARGRALLGAGPALAVDDGSTAAMTRALDGCDAVINLAGAPVAGKRWTAARRRAIEDSRAGLTRRLVGAMAGLESPPRVLVSASAVGVYGDRGDEILDERSEAGEGFLADVCRRWEREAARADERGQTRVVLLRIGVVLGKDGGALAKMLPAFKRGLGGPLGSGSQYMPWIHLTDLHELIVKALEDDSLAGPLNATAPAPVSNRQFTEALGQALGRSAWVRAPALALKAVFGEAASVLLASQRVLPARALEAGFVFRYADVAGALAEVVAADDSVVIRPFDGRRPPSEYLARRKPRYVLEQQTVVPAPLDEVFDYFSRPENLGALTPTELGFQILTPGPIVISAGTVIDYRIALGPLPMRWRTVIERWEDKKRFVDSQHRGPYRCWWHEHHFEDLGDGRTLMTDRVYYAPPLGILGRIANRLFIAPMLRRIFGYRGFAMERRFGGQSQLKLELGRAAA